jgi:hypothetical protein
MALQVRLSEVKYTAHNYFISLHGTCICYDSNHFITSGVPAVLLQGSSSNACISRNLYCLKTYHRFEHSMCVVKHNRELFFLNPTSLPGVEPRTVFGLVTLVAEISLKQTVQALPNVLFYCA